MPFYVDSRVIVPRSFIGELLFTPDALPLQQSADDIASVLDLCTGSGCLAILAAMTFPRAEVDAADLSPEALAVARRNIDEHALAERISLHEGDLYGALPPRCYDLIIANPPYVDAQGMKTLPPEFLHETRDGAGAAGGH